jgi:membrane associated rhomboid family serine protease
MDQQSRYLLTSSFLYGLILAMLVSVVYFFDQEFDLNLYKLGVYPRTLSGLKGIIFYPFIHGSLQHLFNNSVPLLVLTACLFYFYRPIAFKTFGLIYLLSGFWIWISARESYHIGASGLLYGLAAFLFFSGIIRKEKKVIALSLMVAFLYGGMVWGILPIQERVSWEGHLWGSVAGVVLAWLFRKKGPQQPLYQWQIDELREQELERERDQIQEITFEEVLPEQNQNTTESGVNHISYKYEYKADKSGNENS